MQPIPYLSSAQAASSSSSVQPIMVDRNDAVKRGGIAEDTSNPRGRPRTKPLPNDDTENTTQPKGRPKSRAKSTPIPMMVNEEGDSQKRQIGPNADGQGKTRAKPKRKTEKEK